MKYLLILTTSLFLWLTANSQTWKTYNTDNSDIPTNEINQIYAENDTSIWMTIAWGTLIHYDGHTFTQINGSPDSSIILQNANCIIKDKAGNYWVSSEYDGMYKFNGDNWTHYTPQDMGFDLGPYESIHLRKMALQNGGPGFTAGALWIATYSRGVIQYDGNSWEVYDTQNSILPGPGVHSVAVEDSPTDTSYMVWIGTGQGLVKYDGTNWENVNVGDESDLWINAITFDKGGITFGNGVMYIGSELGTFGIYENDNWVIYSVADPWNPNNSVNEIKVDADHNVWMATSNEGVAFYDETQFIYYYQDNSEIPANNVYSLDVSNNSDSIHVWMNANYTGLTVLGKTLVNGINENSITQGLNLSVFPNPVRDILNVSFELSDYGITQNCPVIISLYDNEGRKIVLFNKQDKISGKQNLTFDLSGYNLPEGVYYLKLSVEKRAVTKKIVIN